MTLDPWNNATDEALLSAYFEGDGGAFAAFFTRHAGRVAGYARKRGVPAEDISDVVQTVFLTLHRKISYYDAGRPALPWFFVIVHNTCVDWLRSHAREQRHSGVSARIHVSEDIPDGAEPADASLHAAAVLATLSTGLRSLESEQQELVRMRVVEGLPFKEISMATGRSEVSLRKAYERTVKSLRNFFASAGVTEE